MTSRADDREPKPAASTVPEFKASQIEFFEKQVRPILQSRCFKCHGGEQKVRGGLNLTSRAAVLRGGDQGSAVSLTKPSESLLLEAINYDGLEMPPSGKLPQAERDVLTRWVREGLPWTPGEDKATPAGKTTEHSTPQSKAYWAYQPVRSPEVPAVKDPKWIRNPIDAFLLGQMEGRGLSPAPAADRVALIRRAFYDLTGLPPQPEDVDAFLADKSPAAYENLIDRLLDSPQYGEKWGRHWLDLVRYAETHGYERDSAKPFAWRYRDYVIDSFNNDKPYDRFLLEQLAGDELDEVTPESLIATGYYRLGIWDDEPADRPLAKYDVLDGVVSTTGQVMLGMSIGCVRCHDHKKDPIPHRDYYRLLAFFCDVTDMNKTNTRRIATAAERQAHDRQVQEKQSREGDLYRQVHQLEQDFAGALREKKGLDIAGRSESDLTDVSYRFYRDTWETLPDFDALKPETTGQVAQNVITLAPASRQEAIGLVFEAKLKVPEDGDYAFELNSTDGARLIVDGRSVINQPKRGNHSAQGRASLTHGLLPIRLEYFNTTNKPRLELHWSGPGVSRRALSGHATAAGPRVLVADSRRDGQIWFFTTSMPGADWMQPAFAADGWKQGPGGFGTKGTPGDVVRTPWRTTDIWLRKKFRIDELPQSLALEIHHDETAEIYLNGKLIRQFDGYTTEYRRVALDSDALKLLVQGENVVAIHCRQTIGGQYIDLGLGDSSARPLPADLIRQYGAEVLDRQQVDRYFALTAQLEESRKTQLPEPGIEVMCVDERGREPTHVLIRGNPGVPGDRVEPGIPEILQTVSFQLSPTEPSRPTSGKRRALAEWITRPDNPLTSRVLVNRLWQYHFGRGIVPSSNDFGLLGEPPTHPELLDWLAADFVRGGWRIKRMHKLIMTSNAYRMSSLANEQGLATDPGNTLFWRFNMRRLTAEEVRDSILSVSGRLNLKAGGPSVYPPISPEVLAGQSRPGDGWGKSPPEEASRRSIYAHVKRSLLVPILSQHDQADTDSSCPVRYTTTVPTQALGMINGDFTNEQAADFAARLEREFPHDTAGQVRRAIRLTTGRNPAAEEVAQDAAFIRSLQAGGKLDPQKALQQYCLLALNTNEFIYLD
jgi:hypothetical protein